MEILEKISGIAGTTCNSYLKKAKDEGKRIIGYFCSYVPEEIFHAAGLVPYRIRSVESSGTSSGDIYYSPVNCSYVRHCFNKALEGDFDFLDGVVFMNGCDHIRRMYDNWRYAGIEPAFLYMFFVPHIIGSNAPEEYLANIRALISWLEESFSVSITDTSLRESIAIYNRRRLLLQELYDRRKEDDVPLTGSEVLSVITALSDLPVEVSIEMLEQLLNDVRGRSVSRGNDLRVFVAGGCLEEVDHMKLVEDEGGVVVSDSICMGARFCDKFLDETGDPVDAIAAGYFYHLSCPRMMDDYRKRLEYIQEMAKKFRIDAIIIEKLKFCDMWGWEVERLRRESKNGNIPPLLALEREIHGGETGQIRTRVQAFYEQVRNKKSNNAAADLDKN